MTQKIHGYCNLCRSRCGAIYTVFDGRLVSVSADPDHPTGKALCPKGRAAPEIAHDPRRLIQPLRRTRPKGDADPGFVTISWDEAMAEIAARLGQVRDETGPEAVAFAVTTPSGTPLSDSIEWIERFVRVFGSPNTVYSTEICNWHKDVAHAFTYGHGIPTPDYANADTILLWGHNPANVWLSQAERIAQGRARGAKVICIDPGVTGNVLHADLQLRIRPATDAALALGLLNLMIERNAFDADFVRQWSNAPFLVRDDTGYFLRDADGRPMVWRTDTGAATAYDAGSTLSPDEARALALDGAFVVDGVTCRPVFALLKERVAAFTPDHVTQVTGIPVADIEAAATLIARSPRVAYYSWTGIGQQANATQTERALAILYAFTGGYDRPGGNVLWSAQPMRAMNGFDLFPVGQREKALGIDKHPLGPPRHGWITSRDFCRSVLDGAPYRVRALFGFGTNLPVSHAGTARIREALAALEFHVQCDRVMTPMAEFADIVLPVTTPWEHEALKAGFEITGEAQELVQLRRQMIDPPGTCRSDTQILFDLACRLGMGAAFFDGDIEAARNHQLEPLGLDCETLRQNPRGIRRPLQHAFEKYAGSDASGHPRGFATPTRRLEIYSEEFLAHGYPPLPQHVSPPRPGPEYPIALTSAKSGLYCHSQGRQIVSLRKRAPDPRVRLHPETAAARGLVEDAWVEIATPQGRARFRLSLDARISRDIAIAEHGWWQACPEMGREASAPDAQDTSNFNAMIGTENVDPISGSQSLRAGFCEIRPIATKAPIWSGMRKMVVSEIARERDGIAAITLVAEDGGRLPGYLPGQHIGVAISADAPAREQRNYSLTGIRSGDDGCSAYRIAVKRIDGLISPHMVGRLAVGDSLWITPPAGNFILPRAGDLPLVMIAGGIGITPFLGLLDQMRGQDHAGEAHLHFSCRDDDAQVFRPILGALDRDIPTLTLHVRHTRPGGAPDQRLTARDIPQDLIGRRARFYICGPAGMIEAMRQGLVARGVPAFDIFSEVFATPAPDPATEPAGPFTVRFARSGKTVQWDRAQGDLLQLAEASGIAVSAGCRVGQCEACMQTVLEGRVHHRVALLDDTPGACLTCQAVPASDLVIDA
ncbi:MAG: molybdopterin-dependent oxidoreductase [Salinarimonas sp.]|nr:molybdopterin-dependent oxidoreductase [Salinarimonas sp.]